MNKTEKVQVAKVDTTSGEYEFHVLEKPSMSIDRSKFILNKLKKVNKISWKIISYKIGNNKNPRVSINLIITT